MLHDLETAEISRMNEEDCSLGKRFSLGSVMCAPAKEEPRVTDAVGAQPLAPEISQDSNLTKAALNISRLLEKSSEGRLAAYSCIESSGEAGEKRIELLEKSFKVRELICTFDSGRVEELNHSRRQTVSTSLAANTGRNPVASKVAHEVSKLSASKLLSPTTPSPIPGPLIRANRPNRLNSLQGTSSPASYPSKFRSPSPDSASKTGLTSSTRTTISPQYSGHSTPTSPQDRISPISLPVGSHGCETRNNVLHGGKTPLPNAGNMSSEGSARAPAPMGQADVAESEVCQGKLPSSALAVVLEMSGGLEVWIWRCLTIGIAAGAALLLLGADTCH